jgi:hypothetical protein
MLRSRATNSSDALSGGNSRATALSLKACPYLATSFFHYRPRGFDSNEATTSLTQGAPSSILAENQQLFALGNVCAYCGAEGVLHWEHIIPVSRGGPDNIDNMVRACVPCNLTKGARDPYQWYLGTRINDPIPRLVLGKFLKVVYEAYSEKNLLDSPEYMKQHAIERVSLSSVFGG